MATKKAAAPAKKAPASKKAAASKKAPATKKAASKKAPASKKAAVSKKAPATRKAPAAKKKAPSTTKAPATAQAKSRKGGYPAYQCFKRVSTRVTYCSRAKKANHAAGATWVGQALAHFGIAANDIQKPFLSNNQPAGATIY
jgi:hypothetical protein